MKSLICAAALGALLTLAAAPAALAETQPSAADALFRATTLDLSAYGETRAQPDMATINLGVSNDAATAAAAMADNSRQMERVLGALKAAGIAARDIQTSNLNLSPKYIYTQNQPARLTGYQASNSLTVTVHDLARLGAAVDATVSAGANQVNGVSFGLNDPTVAENAARLEAVKALQAKADLYAKATGYRVLRLVSLSEGGGYAPSPPQPLMRMAKAEAAAPGVRVEPGELKVRVDIGGLYELSR